MSIQYVMRAFNTVLNHHVVWSSINSIDTTGALSGYPIEDLTSIIVNYQITVPDTIGLGPLELLEGNPGPAGIGYFSGIVASSNVTSGKAVVIINNQIVPFSLAALISAGGIGGVAITSANVGLSANVRTQGPDTTIPSLGAGIACVVGCESDGTLCRITNSSCVTGLYYVGYCDINGKITVAPRISDNYNIRDFGAIGDGSSDDTAIIQSAINTAVATGATVYFPATGSYYKVTSAITLPLYSNLIGDFSQNNGVTNIGSVIKFVGSGAGFVMNGSSITIKNLTLSTNASAGPHILQETGTVWGLWQIDNVRMICGNASQGAIVLGSSADGYGVQNNWSTFSRIDILSGASQSVPIIQLYGQGGGLNNMSIRDCVLTGGGTASSGSQSTAEFIRVQSTDSGLIVNMEFHNISFEIPQSGAIAFKSVSNSKITNCWAGDLTGHNPVAPLILIDKSSNTGAGTSDGIIIDTLFTDIGNDTVGQETVSVTFAGQGPVTLINSKIPSINNGGPGTSPIINVGSIITYIIGDPFVGVDERGFVHSRAQFIDQSTIILANGLNSDVSPNFYSGFAKVTSTAIDPISLGGLALGFYGSDYNEGLEFTLWYNHNQPLTIVNEDTSSTAAYRITTLTGQNILAGTPCLIKFVYDNSTSRWLVQNIFNGASGTSVVDIRAFGAIGDGVTDDTSAIQNAITFAKAYSPTNNKFGGTKIYFSKGTYLCSSQINFDTTAGDLTHDWPNTTLCGDGGGLTSPGDNRAASTLIFTGTGSGSFISARDTANFGIRDLCVIYQSPLFTGTLVDCGAGTLDVGSTYTILDNCTFGCDNESYTSAATLVSVAGSYAATISNCHIGDGYYGIMIAIEGGGASASVITNIHNCQFNLCTAAAIGNPSFQTSIIGCTFEDVDRAVYTNFVTLNEPAIFGFVFASNWCGDNSNNLTPWIDFGNGITSGGAIYGNIFSTASETDPSIPNKDAVKVGSATGLAIYGNSMGTIDFSLVSGGSYAHGVTIYSNELEGTNSTGAPYFRNLNNNSNGVVIYGNYPDLDQMGISGHIVTWPTLNTAPGIVATTNASAALDGDNFQGSNDISGRITLTVSGGSTSSGIQCTVTFTKPFDVIYGKNPHIFLTAENDVTAALMNNIYASSNGTIFTIGSINGITPGTYVWSYFVIQ